MEKSEESSQGYLSDCDETKSNYLEISEEDESCRETFGKYMLLFKLTLVVCVNFMSFSLLAPFFPIEASQHGASKLEIGFIFGISSITAFPASLIYGVMLPRVGVQRFLVCGMFTTGTAVVLLAFVHLINSSRLFVVLCMVLRALAAAGSAATVTTTRAIVMTKYSDNIGFSMGTISTGVQLGFTIGPVIGGTLYMFGGFKLPFLVIGSTLLLLLLVVLSSVPKEDVKSKQSDVRYLCKALSVPGVSMMALTIAVLISDLSVIDPTLAPHVKKIDPHISAGVIGLIFLLNGLVVGVLSPLSGWIADKTGCNEVLVVSGLIMGSLSLELIGPAPFLTSILPTKKLWLVCLAMALNGSASAFTLPPSVTIMKKYARKAGMADDLTTNGVISGIFTAASKFGSFSGPVFGGFVVQWIGFRWCAAIFGITSLSQAMCTAIFTYFISSTPRNEKVSYKAIQD